MPDLTQNRFLVVFLGGYVCNFNMLRSTHVFVILLLVNSSWLCLHLWARVNMHGHGDMPVFSFSIFSHVFAIPFVSCLLGNKSWKHNGSCLGLDNSHNEWEWERREGQGERKTERGHRKLSSHHTVIFFFFLMSRFIKPFVFNLFT